MLKMTRFRSVVLLSTSIIGCISLSRMGNRTNGGSPYNFYAGKAPAETSPTLISLDLKRGFEENGRLVQVLPVTGPLAAALVAEQGKKDGATKKKLHERTLLLNSVFVDGYSCFDILVRDTTHSPKGLAGGKLANYAFNYSNEKRGENSLEHGPLNPFEVQRVKLQNQLEKYVPLPEGSGHTERKVMCSKHIHFSSPFKVTVITHFDGQVSAHVLNWTSDGAPEVAKK